ncbi:hypothetical protein C1H46_014676 [Malus baccata]|uniref:Uncharacterized protein n=1 Tax=Malus baccata TaxID=106549 RepID=A0A540MLT7_MALBA|nr:hypothetical protein C1H46_014676 [Malus baccata]
MQRPICRFIGFYSLGRLPRVLELMSEQACPSIPGNLCDRTVSKSTCILAVKNYFYREALSLVADRQSGLSCVDSHSAPDRLPSLIGLGHPLGLCYFGLFGPERTREGNKFIVAEKPLKQTRRSFCAETADSVIEERKCRKEFAANGFFDESGNDNSSSNLLDGLFADVRI